MKRLAALPSLLVALVLAAFGVEATSPFLVGQLGRYDEGLLVTDAMWLARGQIPYRDFYANYPPGPFLLVRLCAWLRGDATIHAMRVTALGIRIAGATLAAILVGRLAGARARTAAFAAILLLQSRVDLTMYAYVTAVTLSLAALLALPTDRSISAHRYALSGALFGLVSWFRHDLFVYAALASSALLLLARAAGRPLLGPLPPASKRAIALGLLAALAPFWGAVLLLGGPMRVLHDLALDQARYVLPARIMPFPSFWSGQPISVLRWTLVLPTMLTDRTALGLVGLGCGVVAGAILVLGQLRSHSLPPARRLATGMLYALLLATAPQALQRTDSVHVGFVVPVVVACVFGTVGALPGMSEILLFFAFLPFVANHPALVGPAELWARLRTRTDEAYTPEDRRLTAELVQRIAAPDEPIFVGCFSHRRLIINYPALYYESRRLAATRIQQFDPGIVTRDDVQKTMVEELQAHRPAAVVLAYNCFWDEPNASRIMGSDRLDRYIAAHYVHVEQIGVFETLRPR